MTRRVHILSFGFQNGKSFKALEEEHGVDQQEIVIFNCRHLTNPSNSLRKRGLTGESKDLRDDFFSHSTNTDYFLQCKQTILDTILASSHHQQQPSESEEKSLVFAFGCALGKHRSVSMAVRMSQELKNYEVITIHRDLDKATNPKSKQKQIQDAKKKRTLQRGGFSQFSE